MPFKIKFWLRFSLLNLFIVAFLGVILRFKIGFEFPYLNQRNIHHAHSHFAFIGWITHTLFIIIVNLIQDKSPTIQLNKYKLPIAVNLISAYGMLIAFFIGGYSIFSISFIVVSFIAALIFTRNVFFDFNKFTEKTPEIIWIKAALLFNLISNLGTVYLVKMMLLQDFDEHWYLSAEYFYLHFLYNGFFVFCCLGLVVNEAIKNLPTYRYEKNIFIGFFAAFIPAYFLSTLWANLPIWLYTLVVLSAILQFVAWLKFIFDIQKAARQASNISKAKTYFFLFVAIAFSIKLILQLASTIPALGTFVFGFRHIVIAYLHLVLLAVISGFIVSYLFELELIRKTKKSLNSIAFFFSAILLNELILAIQGIASFTYHSIPYVNEILFVVALFLLFGVSFILWTQQNKT